MVDAAYGRSAKESGESQRKEKERKLTEKRGEENVPEQRELGLSNSTLFAG